MKVIVFGTGEYGREYIEKCPSDNEIIAVCDNNYDRLSIEVQQN